MIYLLSLIGGLLYRVRGGWLKDEWFSGSTQLVRLAWALPTGGLMVALTDLHGWQLAGFMAFSVVMVFLSVALIGHGAHMLMLKSELYRSWPKNPTEVVTFWLPDLFGEVPDITWSQKRLFQYHSLGMSTIGLCRHIIVAMPFIFLENKLTISEIEFILLGLSHGPIYNLGSIIRAKFFSEAWVGSQISEFLIGTFMWLCLLGLFL